MTVRKTLLALATATLMIAPAWVLPGPALSHPNGPPNATPNNSANPGAEHRSAAATEALEDAKENGKHETGKHENHGSSGDQKDGSHKCVPHKVAYVASGTLESWSLTLNKDGTYSGAVTVKVTHTNHHAAGDKGTIKEYKGKEVENVRVTFGLDDTNKDGSVGLDDLAKGDRVKVIGKIEALAKKCSHAGFEPKTTLHHIVFHAPSKG
jgi:hypothetical protein